MQYPAAIKNYGYIIHVSPRKIVSLFIWPFDIRGLKMSPSVITIILSIFFETFNFLFRIGVPVDNAVIALGEERRDAVIHTHAPIHPQAPSLPGWHITLSRVPCAIQ